VTHLLPQKQNQREISEQQENFLTNLFENGGNITDAALTAGYAKGSVTWLRTSLADEIINRTKNVLSMNAFKAATRLVSTIDNPVPERGDDLRFRAAESLLNRVGLGKQETTNVNVQAVHGIVYAATKERGSNDDG
jgi:phage terminase small subunit